MRKERRNIILPNLSSTINFSCVCYSYKIKYIYFINIHYTFRNLFSLWYYSIVSYILMSTKKSITIWYKNLIVSRLAHTILNNKGGGNKGNNNSCLSMSSCCVLLYWHSNSSYEAGRKRKRIWREQHSSMFDRLIDVSTFYYQVWI